MGRVPGRYKLKPTSKFVTFDEDGRRCSKNIPLYGKKFEEIRKRFLEDLQHTNEKKDLSAKNQPFPKCNLDAQSSSSQFNDNSSLLAPSTAKTSAPKGDYN